MDSSARNELRFAALAEGEALRRALRPLGHVPTEPGWNATDLEGLVPAGEPREAAVLVGLVPRAGGTQVLLTRRADALRNHGGQVSFPGGGIDAGDADAVATALRECAEETAIPAAQIEPLGFLDPFLTVSSYRVVPVVATISPDYLAMPNPGEVAEVFEVPLAFLMDRDNLRRVEMDFKGKRRVILEYAWPGQRIWGATASMLANLRQRLEKTALEPRTCA